MLGFLPALPPLTGPALVALCLACSGCAVNHHGLVTVSRYESESAYLVRMEMWGVHILTNEVDGGITIGKSTRLYVHPKPEKVGSDRAGYAVPNMDRIEEMSIVRKSRDQFPAPATLGSPLAVVADAIGIALSLNAVRIGASIGIQRRAITRLRSNFEGVFLLKYDSEKQELPRVFYQGGAP